MVIREKMKIMLVDDEERFLQTSQKMIAKKGYEALIAASGAECLKKLEEEPVHVIILDVKMPGMDGIETLKHIKQRFPLMEVIMLTGHADTESAVEGMKLGAPDYLAKPIEIEDLVVKAEEAFNKRVVLEQKIPMAEALKKSNI